MADRNLPSCMYTHQSGHGHGSRAAHSACFFLVSSKLYPSNTPLGKLRFTITFFALVEVE